MSEFVSRYGGTASDVPGCPEGMYPWDADYAEVVHETFEEFRASARHDSLNLPISWYFSPEDEGGGFELVYVMPRKYGKTWSMCLNPGYDRAEVEAWLEDWTRSVAANHYGWTAPATDPEESA